MTEKRYESDLTRKEKWQLEKEKIKKMGWKERLAYIWTYYKPHMAGFLALIMFGCMVGQIIYRAQFDTIFSVAVINGGSGNSEFMQSDFKSYLGDEDKYHEVVVDTSMYLLGDDGQDYTSITKLTTLVGARDLDAMISPRSQVERFTEMEGLVPMDELLTPEQIEVYGDDVSEYGLRVNGSEKLKELGMNLGEDAYLSIFVCAKDMDRAKSFITYIYEGGK